MLAEVGGRATGSSASRQYCACQYTISYIEHQDNGVVERTEVFPSCSRTLYNRDLIQLHFRVCVYTESLCIRYTSSISICVHRACRKIVFYTNHSVYLLVKGLIPFQQ